MTIDSLPPNHPLAGAEAKVERADENLKNLKAEIQRFGEGGGHTITEDFDPDTGEYIVRIKPADPPLKLAAIIGNILGDLRSSLDYLVYALAHHDSGKPQSGTQFPIVDDPADFERLRPTYLKGVSGAHVAWFEGVQPYEAGSWTRLLRDLSNSDKHRKLVPVAAIARGRTQILSTEPETEWSPTRPANYDDMGVYLSMFFDIRFEDRTRPEEVLNLLQRQVALFIHISGSLFNGPTLKLV